MCSPSSVSNARARNQFFWPPRGRREKEEMLRVRYLICEKRLCPRNKLFHELTMSAMSEDRCFSMPRCFTDDQSLPRTGEGSVAFTDRGPGDGLS